MSNGNLIEILLVEDNPGDATLIVEALKDAKVNNTLHVAHDGVEAMEYLRASQDESSTVTRPGMILLDLNLPRKDGREVLKEVKSDKDLRSIPIVVMTTSEDEDDILKAYDDQANCFITKPVDFEQLTKAVQFIKDFWLTLAQLPNSEK